MSINTQDQQAADVTPSDADSKPKGIGYQVVTLREMVSAPKDSPESLLGDRVRYARNDLNLKVEALSRLTKEYDLQGTGISPTSISRYEAGDSLPGLREFRLLAESLDVPIGWLLYGTKEDRKTGISETDRSMLDALNNFVLARREDAELRDRSQEKWFAAEVRMQRLSRAKKPSQDEYPN